MGKLVAEGKIRGRKQSLIALVDNMEKKLGNYQNDVVFISHGDSEEDALFVKELVQKDSASMSLSWGILAPSSALIQGLGRWHFSLWEKSDKRMDQKRLFLQPLPLFDEEKRAPFRWYSQSDSVCPLVSWRIQYFIV